MIRLTDILLESEESSDEELAELIASFRFGSSYSMINKGISPEFPNTMVYIFASYNDPEYHRYVVKRDGEWLYNKGGWEKHNFPKPKPIKPILSPEELAAKAERKQKRDDAEARRQAEELKQKQAFDAKCPNFSSDWNSDTTGNTSYDEIIKSSLTQRAAKIVFMRHKSYTFSDLSYALRISPARLNKIYHDAIKRLKNRVKIQDLLDNL